MNPAHLHLTVNEVPVLGTIAATILLAIGLVVRSRSAWVTAGLLALGVSAVVTVIAFWSGSGAIHVIAGLPRTSNRALEAHHMRATIASVLLGVAAVAAAVVFGVSRRRRADYRRGAIGLVLILALASAGGMAWTALAGGRINHQELQQPDDLAGGVVRAD